MRQRQRWGVKPTGQRGTSESPIQANCQDKKAMKSVMQTIVSALSAGRF